MKYRPLFRLLLKLVGVYFAIGGLLAIIPSVSWTFLAPGDSFLSGFNQTGPGFIKTLLGSLTGPFIKVAIGLYLFFGGKWIVELAFPQNRSSCPECACELSGPTTVQCPDCGFELQAERMG